MEKEKGRRREEKKERERENSQEYVYFAPTFRNLKIKIRGDGLAKNRNKTKHLIIFTSKIQTGKHKRGMK